MIFWEYVDKGVSGCSLVVLVLRVKIGLFWCCYVTLPQLLFAAVLLATFQLLPAFIKYLVTTLDKLS